MPSPFFLQEDRPFATQILSFLITLPPSRPKIYVSSTTNVQSFVSLSICGNTWIDNCLKHKEKVKGGAPSKSYGKKHV